MKILITGANGFVGTRLVPRLADAGHEVIAAVFPDGKHVSETLDRASRVMELDLTSDESVRAAVAEHPDAVVHLGAVASGVDARANPGRAWDVNAAGTARLAHFLSELRAPAAPRLLCVSTAEVYGSQPADAMFTEESPTLPVSPYAASKLAAEIAVREVNRRTGLPVTIARPFGHTGAGQDTRFVVPSFARRIVDGKAMRAVAVPVGNLEGVRDFLHVEDVVSAYVLLLQTDFTGEVFNIASGRGTSLRDVFMLVADAAGARVIPEVDGALTRSADIPYLVGNATKLRNATGWEPEHSLEETIQEVVDACS